ncbi:hypothetical protein EDS67_00675 [candidate division KSB1 bacterium]|nr:MAG: hypothetical protein EDS67_00675 [candidate division KSB1 bacterium]MCE7940114.1 hypothetical protein [Chlorobi bacterium CHB1]MDL1873588.1 hypothetical protein [Cytophagia bacterium CHB2]
MKKTVLVLALITIVQGSSMALAQEKKLTFHAAGGASAPLSNQTFRDTFSVGANGSIGLDVRVSPKLVVGPELGYSAFGLDREGFLKLNEVEDTDDIKIKGGEMSVAGILGIAKFHLNTVEANTGFNLVAGAGLSASRIAKIAIETPEGDFEIASESASQFEIFDRGFVKE